MTTPSFKKNLKRVMLTVYNDGTYKIYSGYEDVERSLYLALRSVIHDKSVEDYVQETKAELMKK